MLLVDKYKPLKISEILGNKETIEILGSLPPNFPHLLLSGPPGCGKTTAAKILAKNFNTLELNASDERGIDTVRTKIKDFCLLATKNKLVILDECDSLTSAAMQALRRQMETTDTKFILICNQMSKLIEPIQSRCAILNFIKIDTEVFKIRLKEIINKENIKITEEGIEAICLLSNGDFRACLNLLQSVSNIETVVDADFIYTINGIPSYSKIKEVLDFIIKKDMENALHKFNDIYAKGYDPSDLFGVFFNIAKDMDNLDLCKVIAQYCVRASDGIHSKTQFYSMFYDISQLK